MAISIIPGIICIGGVFFIHFGIYSSIILFFGSMGIGIGNAMNPLRNQDSNLIKTHNQPLN